MITTTMHVTQDALNKFLSTMWNNPLFRGLIGMAMVQVAYTVARPESFTCTVVGGLGMTLMVEMVLTVGLGEPEATSVCEHYFGEKRSALNDRIDGPFT